jgi:uncharacterized membrane protein YeaQ/YmgE (transglycosylase-associated protein family)
MTGLTWVLVVAGTGWLTGKLFGAKGYGKILSGYVVDSMDIILGIGGAWIASSLFYSTVFDDVGLLSKYAASIAGAVILVGISRLLPTNFSGPLTRQKPYRSGRLKK